MTFRMKILSGAIVALLSLPALVRASDAESPPPGLYAQAERAFAWLERTSGLRATDIVSHDDGVYYYRCYNAVLCLGVGRDGFVYVYDGKDIKKLQPLSSYLGEIPETGARIMSHLEGALAGDAQNCLTPSGDSGSPILIGEGLWQDADRSAITAAFTSGVAVAIVNATLDEINDLRRLVGLAEDSVLPTGAAVLDLYALRRNSNGDLFELELIPPPTSGQASVTTQTTDEQGNMVSEETHLETVVSSDSKADQSIRFRLFLDWLEQSARTNQSERSQALQSFAQEVPVDLAKIASIYKKQQVFQYGYDKRFDKDPLVKNVALLNYSVVSFYAPDQQDNWFWFKQDGSFSASNQYKYDSTKERGIFVTGYQISTGVKDWTGKAGGVELIQHSPATTEGKTTVTSGVQWNFSGKATVSDKGAGVELGGGVTVSNSQTFDIPDISLSNLSGNQINNASWRFDITKPDRGSVPLGCIREPDIDSVKRMSYSTFSPTMQWIWKVPANARAASPAGLKVDVEFGAKLAHYYYKDRESGRPFALACPYQKSEQDFPMKDSFVVAWPPMAANK